jgi:glucoamylase
MRDIPVGNGTLLVSFDNKYQIRDVYFPHVGQENHTSGSDSRFGIWVDGVFSWLSSDAWVRKLRYLPETLVTDVTVTNESLQIEIVCNDTVASHENIFLRRITVRNLGNETRSIRVFLHHDLRIYENPVGDTAFFDPATKGLIHYKKHRYFLFNTAPHFDSFATGRKAFREHEGTWRDAEDGFLSGGSITEGSVDSTIGVHTQLDAGSEFEAFYWMAAGWDYDEVAALNSHVIERGPEEYLEYTSNYWRAWVNKNNTDFGGLPAPVIDLYKRSLLIVRTQADREGALLAANDSDVTERATDHYSYLWTRDGAFIANALDLAGYSHLTRKFFDLCARIVHPKGYFLQKYNPDGTVASGWHAVWDPGSQSEMVPIQEDETALVLWALWEHYDKYRDIEFAHRLYTGLVVSCADFMTDFLHPDLGLPAPSWNLWEDRRGIHTFTCATVVAGLRAAANFAELFAETERVEKYRKTADDVTTAMTRHLYSGELGRFLRSLQFDNGDTFQADTTVDASLFAVFYFHVFPADDPMVTGTMRAIKEDLTAGNGIARFQNDGYMRVPGSTVSNAWFICTLWLADYYIAAAATADDLKQALDILNWTVANALPSGVLAEQIDTATGEHISVSPLTWSHSTFVATVHNYLSAQRRLVAG